MNPHLKAAFALASTALAVNERDATDPAAYIAAATATDLVRGLAVKVALPQLIADGAAVRSTAVLKTYAEPDRAAAPAAVTVTVTDLPRDTRRRDAEDADPRVTRTRVEIPQNLRRQYAALRTACERAAARVKRDQRQIREEITSRANRGLGLAFVDTSFVRGTNRVRSTGHAFGWEEEWGLDYSAFVRALERRGVLGTGKYTDSAESPAGDEDLIEFGDLVRAARDAAGGWIESDEEFLSVVRQEYAVLRAQGAAR